MTKTIAHAETRIAEFGVVIGSKGERERRSKMFSCHKFRRKMLRKRQAQAAAMAKYLLFVLPKKFIEGPEA